MLPRGKFEYDLLWFGCGMMELGIWLSFSARCSAIYESGSNQLRGTLKLDFTETSLPIFILSHTRAEMQQTVIKPAVDP